MAMESPVLEDTARPVTNPMAIIPSRGHSRKTTRLNRYWDSYGGCGLLGYAVNRSHDGEAVENGDFEIHDDTPQARTHDEADGIENYNERDDSDAGKVPGLSRYETKGPDEAVHLSDDEHQDDHGNQERHQFHQAAKRSSLDMPFNPAEQPGPADVPGIGSRKGLCGFVVHSSSHEST